MIDIEADVFNAVYPAVSQLVPAKCFKNVYVPNPPKFPFATLVEIDNTLTQQYRDSALTEKYATVTYEANVYAMDKKQCRQVMTAIDQSMIYLGFGRISARMIPNLNDEKVFRIVARYRAVADTNKVIYRR